MTAVNAEAGDYIEDDPAAWSALVDAFGLYASQLDDLAEHLGTRHGAVEVLAGAMLSRLADVHSLYLRSGKAKSVDLWFIRNEIVNLDCRMLDDDGDGYGGVAFVSVRAVMALLDERTA